MSSRFNKDIASRAITNALPMIDALIKNGVVCRGDLYIMVGNKNGDVLASKSFGNIIEWEYQYDRIAKSKFKITVRTGQATRIVQLMTPELAGEVGDTFYWGSWIDGGIIASCSGVEPYWDEAISKTLVAMARALVTEKQLKEKEKQGGFRK